MSFSIRHLLVAAAGIIFAGAIVATTVVPSTIQLDAATSIDTPAATVGADSTASSAVATIPDAPAPGTPGAPTAVTGMPAVAQVVVSWTAPADPGDSPISGYNAFAASAGQPIQSCTTTSSSCTISGLVNGATYTVVVSATNNAGAGAGSTPISITVPLLPPGAPQSVHIDPGDGKAAVSWTAPTDALAAGYTATASIAGTTTPVMICTSTTDTSCTIFPLKHNVTFDITVTANNAAGVGPASEPVTVTTPAGAPYTLTSSSYTIKPLQGAGPYKGFCDLSYHVDSDWNGPGAGWQPHLTVTGQWIKLGTIKPVAPHGTDANGKQLYNGVAVNLYNESAASSHAGSFAWTCMPT